MSGHKKAGRVNVRLFIGAVNLTTTFACILGGIRNHSLALVATSVSEWLPELASARFQAMAFS